MTNLITITSDFDKFYANQMIGKILEINPKCKIYANKVNAYSIYEASFTISEICRSFPEAIHIGVVDPGVGSKRKGLIIKTEEKLDKNLDNFKLQHETQKNNAHSGHSGHSSATKICTKICYFIGPDNGIFSLPLKNKKILKIISIDEKKFSASKTFHGRDIFAVIAGEISKAIGIEKFGKEIEKTKIKKIKTENKIIYIDNFGNVITGIEKKEKFENKKNITIKHKGKTINAKFCETFSDVKKGFMVYEGSAGFLEIALYKGNAKEEMKACVGDEIEIY